MSIPLSVLAQYEKFSKRAADKSAGGENERQVAEGYLGDLRREHPGIEHVYTRVILAQNGMNAPPPFSGGGAQGGAAARPSNPLADAIRGFGDRVVNGVAGELSGAGRFDALKRNELSVRDHECGHGQRCVEFRFNAADFKRSDKVLDAIRRELE